MMLRRRNGGNGSLVHIQSVSTQLWGDCQCQLGNCTVRPDFPSVADEKCNFGETIRGAFSSAAISTQTEHRRLRLGDLTFTSYVSRRGMRSFQIRGDLSDLEDPSSHPTVVSFMVWWIDTPHRLGWTVDKLSRSIPPKRPCFRWGWWDGLIRTDGGMTMPRSKGEDSLFGNVRRRPYMV